tara:strand:- start:1459 stop:2664 length:1206 start_codon:yes stop_codon:yes gene_type:complete
MKKIFYGRAVYDQKEINAVNKVLKKDSLTLIDGRNVKKLENVVAKIFGKKYGLMVNSGSSANLLALSSLKLKKGSEVITPTLTFSTTVAPIYQLGLIANFVGVLDNKFIADPEQIKKAINKNTSAIMIPNLLGNVADWKIIHEIAKDKNIPIIEDSADTIGYKYKKGSTGKFSDIVTNSFYASHIISGAGFGGIVCFNDYEKYKFAKLLRGWGRSSATFNESESSKKRFNIKISGIDYDKKYIFKEFGYNFLPSEISAAFALEQVKKLKNNIKIRQKNFNDLKTFFSAYKKYFKLPESYNFVKTPWLAFPLVIIPNKKFRRKQLQIYFEDNNIQTRTIFTGNILKQPVMVKKKYKKNPNSENIANDVMKNGILIGCHQGLKKSDLNYIFYIFKKFVKRYML